jgi:hypothetical protein
MDEFGDMGGGNNFCAFQVGDGAGNLEDAGFLIILTILYRVFALDWQFITDKIIETASR